MNSDNQHYINMTTVPVHKLVSSLAVPTIITMMMSNIYNMVDTAFVGTLGTSASGAVGIVFGFMAILQAFAFMFGQGGGVNVGRFLGKQDKEEATAYASTSFFLSFGFGILIGVISYLFLDPMILFLGSTETIAPYAKQYIKFIILGAPFISSSFTLNNLLRYEGKARLGMIGLMIGAMLNIAADAVFIFVLHLGVSGAGIATALSQLIGFCILLSMFRKGKTQTQIRISAFRLQHSFICNICITGFPSLLRQALASITTILMNTCSGMYGDAAVAAMSIVSRISFFVMSIPLGIGQGFQPVSSFNYGAKKYDRVISAYWFTVKLSTLVICVSAGIAFIFASPLVRIFRDDELVTYYAVRALRLQSITSLTIPFAMITEMGFQSTGQKLLASIASSLRGGLFFIPSLLLLSHFRGMAGIQESQSVAHLLSLVVAIGLNRIYLNRLDNMKEAL